MAASRESIGHGFARHFSLTISVGLVGAFILGSREALLSVSANAVVQPDQYFFAYIAVPILAWLPLGALAMVPVAFGTALFRPAWESSRLLAIYAGVFTIVGCLSIVLPITTAVAGRLSDVGMHRSPLMDVWLWVPALAASAASSTIVGKLVASWGAGAERAFRLARHVVMALAVVLLWPIGRFLLSDWKWGLHPVHAKVAAQPSKPNILLISIDTLRADHLGVYGDSHHLTPNLDTFARQGICFLQTITSSPWTLPAMASLFTAHYPHHHHAGEITNGRTPLGRSALPTEAWTLTAALREQGYRTAAIVTNPYLALRYGLGGSFESYQNVSVESEAFVSFGETTAMQLVRWLWPTAVIGDRAETVSGRAERWFASAPAQPFFLWLHYIDPHPPYSLNSPNKSMRGDLSFGSGDEEFDDPLLTSPDVARLRSGEIRLSAAQKENVRDLYRSEVRRVDAAVGRALEALDRAQFADSTLVIIVGDHGEEFWEHGGVEHGRTVYDEVVRVPLLMRWSGRLPSGMRINRLVRIVDVSPTILDLLHAQAPPGRDGQSLLAILNGLETTDRVALIENMLFAEERIGLRTRDRKYVQWEDGREELYDLTTDPDERRDLAGTDTMVQPFRKTLASVSDSSIPFPVDASALQPRAGTREALRALGYLQ